MTPAAATLEVLVDQPEPPRATILRMMLGPLGRHPAHREVLVVDRVTRRLVLRIPVSGPEPQARALATLLTDDLQTLDERAFLKRHGRAHRSR